MNNCLPKINIDFNGDNYCGLVPIIQKDNIKTIPLFMNNSAGGKGLKGDSGTPGKDGEAASIYFLPMKSVSTNLIDSYPTRLQRLHFTSGIENPDKSDIGEVTGRYGGAENSGPTFSAFMIEKSKLIGFDPKIYNYALSFLIRKESNGETTMDIQVQRVYKPNDGSGYVWQQFDNSTEAVKNTYQPFWTVSSVSIGSMVKDSMSAIIDDLEARVATLESTTVNNTTFNNYVNSNKIASGTAAPTSSTNAAYYFKYGA